MQGMKRFLKGKLARVDRGADPKAKSHWAGVQNATKNMTLEQALIIDKQNEEKERMVKSRLWFHPDTNRNLAETKLREAGLQNGTFLIRPSAFKGNYVLSMVAKDQPRHYQIKQRGSGCYYVVEEHLFRGVDQLVDFYLENVAGLPTHLRKVCPGSPPPMECRALGYTNLLHQCIIENETSKALKILSHRLCPNVDGKNSRGYTALHEACVLGQEKVVQKLIERGADTSSQQLDGHTPLMLCCIHNKPTIIRLLVTVGKADTQDTQIPSGNVALHKAAAKGHLDCIKMLLSLRAPAWPRNVDGLSPHDLALAEGYRECGKYIDNFTALPAETNRKDWYHGEMEKLEAEAILRKHDCREGVFLVRKSVRRRNTFVLVLSSEFRIYNYEIHELDGVAYYIDSGPLFSSLEHVIEYYSLRADGLSTRLVYGIDPEEGREIPILGDHKNNRSGSSGSASATQQLGRLPAVPPVRPRQRPPEPDKLNRADLEFGREIGEGEYGSVYRGTWTAPDKSKHAVAIKTLHVRHTSARENFLAEARVMVQLDHPCIVHLIGVCTEPSIMLVQELVPLGSMLDYMLDYPDRINPNPDLYIWASQIASGMNYLEERRFVHRDLAARNILLKSKTQAKVGDFGLSRATGAQSDDYQASVGGRWPIKWYAPECVNFGTFSSRSDVWSFGVTLWEMFTLGDPPYGEKTGAQVIALVDRGDRLPKPCDCTEDVYKLMLSCWEYDAGRRPTFKELYRRFCEDYSEIPGIRLNTQSSSQI